MISSPRPAIGTAVLIALGSAPLSGQVRVLVTSIGYESPTLVAPVVLLSFVSASGKGVSTLGVAGYTLTASRIAYRSPTVATVVALEVTPRNANGSNYVYRDGKRDSALAFRDANVALHVGLRFSHEGKWSRWGVEFGAIGLDEWVSRVADPSVVSRWRDPYVGLRIAANYSRVISEDPLAARWDGVKAAADFVGLAGAQPWWKSRVWLGGGKRVGRISIMGRAWLLFGQNLDMVNQHLVGGSWDLDRSPSLYGYHYAEFRVNRGAVLTAGADLRLRGPWELGVRAGYLTSPARSTYGGAIRLSTAWSGIAFHIGVGLPRADAPLVFAGMSAAVL